MMFSYKILHLQHAFSNLIILSYNNGWFCRNVWLHYLYMITLFPYLYMINTYCLCRITISLHDYYIRAWLLYHCMITRSVHDCYISAWLLYLRVNLNKSLNIDLLGKLMNNTCTVFPYTYMKVGDILPGGEEY